MILGTRAGFYFALFFLLATEAAAQQDAAHSIDAPELLSRAFVNLYGEDYVQSVKLSTRSRGGSSMTRSMQITRKQSAEPGKALVRFTDPADIRKTSILILENRNASDDLYVYLPGLRRTKHLSSSQRGDAFFGTDLSYEDVEPKRAEDYHASWIGAGGHEGQPCLLIEIVARPEIDTAYDKMVSCIEAERAIILWTDFYERGKVSKRLEVELADIRSVAGRFIPFSMTIRTPRKRSETRYLTSRYELRTDIPDELFSTWNLEAGDARRDRSRSASDADPKAEVGL
jgi:hypothetical protein